MLGVYGLLNCLDSKTITLEDASLFFTSQSILSDQAVIMLQEGECLHIFTVHVNKHASTLPVLPLTELKCLESDVVSFSTGNENS